MFVLLMPLRILCKYLLNIITYCEIPTAQEVCFFSFAEFLVCYLIGNQVTVISRYVCLCIAPI